MAGKKYFRTDFKKSPIGRVSYAYNLFDARDEKKDDGSTVKKWGATLIFPNSEKPWFENLLREVIVGEWGEAGLVRAGNGLIKSPLLKGDGKEARNKETGELHPGMGPDVFFIRVNSNNAVTVRFKSETIPATKDEVFSGCYGFAALNGFAWNNSKNGDGVSIGITYFQKTEDGERLGGESGPAKASDWFEKVADAGDAPDETKNGQGAGGLFG